MGTTLTGQTQSSTYDSLLKVTDNGPIGSTAKVITDGLGNDSAFKLGTLGAEFTGLTVFPAGTVLLPSVYFSTDSTTGIYRIAANNLGVSVSAAKVLDISTTGLGVTGTLVVSGATDLTGALTLTGGLNTPLAVAQGGTAGATPAAARTNLGIMQANLNSDLAASSAINQAGTLAADLVFNTPGAPTVSLTTGTWLLTGSVTARTSDTAVPIWAQFYNNTDASAFGGSGIDANIAGSLGRRAIPVSGLVTVASGTKVIYFKVFRSGSATLDVGAAAGPAGFIQAVQLYL